MESDHDEDVDYAVYYRTVDVDLYLKDLISLKKPRRIEIDDDK